MPGETSSRGVEPQVPNTQTLDDGGTSQELGTRMTDTDIIDGHLAEASQPNLDRHGTTKTPPASPSKKAPRQPSPPQQGQPSQRDGLSQKAKQVKDRAT